MLRLKFRDKLCDWHYCPHAKGECSPRPQVPLATENAEGAHRGIYRLELDLHAPHHDGNGPFRVLHDDSGRAQAPVPANVHSFAGGVLYRGASADIRTRADCIENGVT